MTIKEGGKLPSAQVHKVGAQGVEKIDLAQYLSGKRAIIFAVPGAFTPSCDQKHLPGYVKNADKLKSEGVDEILCWLWPCCQDFHSKKLFSRRLEYL